MTLVERATSWPSNGHMIADMARLGYLKATDVVLDPTFGRGLWWTRWKPATLIGHDSKLTPGFDFRSMPFGENVFDAVVFDPPYVATGGRKTSTMQDFLDRYGLLDACRTPAEMTAYNIAGLVECARVLRPTGFLLAKSMNYVSSGKLVVQVYDLVEAGRANGLTLVDEAIHLGKPRPQDNRPQVHTRANYSNLLIFQKGK